MWELDYKESWAQKNWCFWTVVLKKTLESPLGCKEIQPVHPNGNQSWIFIGRTNVEAETPILWPPDAKNWLIWKDPDAGKDWRWEEKGTTEDEMVGWHHRLNGLELNSGSWWWTGRPGMLQSMGSQRIRHWATELKTSLLSVSESHIVFLYILKFLFYYSLFILCIKLLLCKSLLTVSWLDSEWCSHRACFLWCERKMQLVSHTVQYHCLLHTTVFTNEFITLEINMELVVLMLHIIWNS